MGTSLGAASCLCIIEFIPSKDSLKVIEISLMSLFENAMQKACRGELSLSQAIAFLQE